MTRCVSLAVGIAVLAHSLVASTSGISVNGTCEAGSCPSTPIPFHTIVTLPFNFAVTLPDTDVYRIFGSLTEVTGGNGSWNNFYAFEVLYEGNASGGASAADTIVVHRYAEVQASASSANVDTALIGAFGGAIASSSSASTCFDGTLGCLGPVDPPGSFNQSSATFTLTNTNGTFPDDKTFTNDFGAGSAIGSYIVWGQTSALPTPTVPEPTYFGILVIGVGALVARKALFGVKRPNR